MLQRFQAKREPRANLLLQNEMRTVITIGMLPGLDMEWLHHGLASCRCDVALMLRVKDVGQ